MSASRTIQAASIPYLDNLSATASALYTSSCLLFWLAFSTSTCSPITIFWICRIQFLPQGCGGSLAHSLLHLFYISFSEFAETSTNSTISYLVSLCLVSVALFSCLHFQPILLLHRHFLHAHFSGFLTFHSDIKTKRKVFHSTFHSLLLLESILLVILYWRGRGNFYFPFSRDCKSPFKKWNLL